MSQSKTAEQQATRQFLQLYEQFRHQDQMNYYTLRVREYTNAQRQAIWLSIGFVFVTALAGALEGVASGWLQTTLLIIAAVSPILSTALAGYTALHGFTQQAKLFRDAFNNLRHIHMPEVESEADPDIDEATVNDYVKKVEAVLQKERSFWGQLAEGMAPPGT
jgi:SMODS and SLOG-associating 2TM effector domain 1